MPIHAKRFGVQLLNKTLRQDRDFARNAASILKDLNVVLASIVDDIVDDVFPLIGHFIDPIRRRRRERGYLSKLRTPIQNAYLILGNQATRHVRGGFVLTNQSLRDLVTKWYPVKYYPRKQREGVERISFAFGAGMVNDDYKNWIAVQMMDGIAPGSLIKTLSADHVGMVQGSMMEMLDKAESFKWAKADALKKITGRVIHPDIRTKMGHNIMRVIRTSYNRGVNQNMMAFASNNRDIVHHLVRQADGRPCAVCCPSGTLISTPGGGVEIQYIEVGDSVFTHTGEVHEVRAVQVRDHEGRMIRVSVGEKSVLLTPEHPVLTSRGWIPAGELGAEELVECKERRFVLAVITTEFGYSDLVYNIEVDVDESYVAEGISVHNCVLLDGMIYRVGDQLYDEHSSGMCILVPVLKTPGEMGIKGVPPSIEKEFKLSQKIPGETLRDKFFAASDAGKREFFQNDKLWRLWKKERFPLDALVRRTGTRANPMVNPASAKWIEDNLEKIGSVSHPKAFYPPELIQGSQTKLNFVVDPIDRANRHLALMDTSPVPRSALKFDPNVPDLNQIKHFSREEKILFQNKIKDLKFPIPDGVGLNFLPPHQWNEVARVAGFTVRKNVTGDGWYYVMDKFDAKRLAKTAIPVKPLQVKLLTGSGKEASFAAHGLAEGEIVKRVTLNTGVNQTEKWVVRTKDGREFRGVWKPGGGAEYDSTFSRGIKHGDAWKREVAASRINNWLDFDIVPTTVARKVNGQWGSVQQWVDGAIDAVTGSGRGITVVNAHTTRNGAEMIVMNVILGNTDRHFGNWMWNIKTKKMIAIDNGFTMGDPMLMSKGKKLKEAMGDVTGFAKTKIEYATESNAGSWGFGNLKDVNGKAMGSKIQLDAEMLGQLQAKLDDGFDNFKAMFSDLEMGDNVVEGAWARMERIVKGKGISLNLLETGTELRWFDDILAKM